MINPQEEKELCFKWFNRYLEKCDPKEIYARAHYSVGWMYLNGWGTAINLEKAFYHYHATLDILLDVTRVSRKYAPIDYPENHMEKIHETIADMYFHGRGTEMDNKKAEYHYLKCLDYEKNNGKALYQLYLIYRDGLTGVADLVIAENYLVRSATANHTEAFYQLGRKYHRLALTEQDEIIKKTHIDTAIRYLQPAYIDGHVDSAITLGLIHWPTKFELCAKYWQCAKEWTTHAERADVNYYLGVMYHQGFFVDKDYEKAIKFHRIFLTKFTDPEQIRLTPYDGIDYKDTLIKFNYDLKEVHKDYPKAYRCCQILSEHGNISAKYMLGWMTWYGHGTEKNETKALEWYYASLLADKTNCLHKIRQELKSYENEIFVRKFSQISDENKALKETSESKTQEVDGLKKQIDALMAQVQSLTSTVGTIKKQQDSAIIIYDSDKEN